MSGFMKRSFEKIFLIHQLISSNKYPNREKLANEVGVDKRTITRYVRWMKDFLGAPVDFDKKNNGYYYSRPFDLMPCNLSAKQVLMFFLLNKVAEGLWKEDSSLSVSDIISKIKNYTDEKIIASVEEKTDKIDIKIGKPREIDSEIFHNLLESLFEKVQCEISYSSISTGPTIRIIEPYHLINISGDWYIIAYCHIRDKVRTFALSRINSLKLLKRPFEIRGTFNIEEYLSDSFVLERGEEVYNVKIKFSPKVSKLAKERVWHKSQRVELLYDGSVILSMNLSGLNELKRWVLSFGENAEVLEPPELRESVRSSVEKLNEIYEY
ncbi:MAG: helix-turn-helix transcriptional regulator [bacterium]